jgi:hypothetical protein
MNRFLLPYLVVLAMFLIVMAMSFYRQRKNSNHARTEARKAKLYLRILKLQIDCDKAFCNKKIKEYKHIKRYLAGFGHDVAVIGGVDMKLENLKIVPVKNNPEAISMLEKLFGEMKKAPDEISNLVWEEMKIINEIGRIKHPVMDRVFFIAQKRDNFLTKLSYSVTSYFAGILDSVHKKQNRRDHVDVYSFALSKF